MFRHIYNVQVIVFSLILIIMYMRKFRRGSTEYSIKLSKKARAPPFAVKFLHLRMLECKCIEGCCISIKRPVLILFCVHDGNSYMENSDCRHMLVLFCRHDGGSWNSHYRHDVRCCSVYCGCCNVFQSKTEQRK